MQEEGQTSSWGQGFLYSPRVTLDVLMVLKELVLLQAWAWNSKAASLC